MIRLTFKNLLLGLFLLSFVTIKADDDFDDCPLDDFDILNELNNQDTSFLESSLPQGVRQATPEDAVAPLITIGGHLILMHDIFLHTNPLNSRSLLDYSIFLAQKPGYYLYPGVFGFHVFFNKTDKMFFTRHSGAISSYLAILDPNLIQDIQNSVAKIDQLDPTFDINPVNILPLFKDARIEQRRLGLMFHGEREWGRINFRGMIPLYYNERNLFLTEDEQEAIEQELGTSDTESQMEFAEEHLISDQFGLGDTRLMVDFDFMGHRDGGPRGCMGLFTTLPTAVAFKKGLKGSFFPKKCGLPTFNFQQFFEPGQTVETITGMVQKFLFEVLDHLSANLLDTQLGNGRHVGLGVQIRAETPLRLFIKRPWAENFYMKGFYSLEYQFPANERRFFIPINPEARFNALGLNEDINTILENLADPAYAQQVLDFLQLRFVQTLYPYVMETHVQPGVIFRWCSKAFYVRDQWGFNIGSDMWIQSPEKLLCLNNCKRSSSSSNCSASSSSGSQQCSSSSSSSSFDFTPAPTLNICKGIKPFGYQAKVIGALFYTWRTPRIDVTLGLNGDTTYATSGIGHDYAVSLNLEFNF